jgi:predicted RND superfamily exporter protein
MTTDTFITVSAMVLLLLILFIWFFRRKRAPILVLIPVLFGGLFSLTCIYFIKGSVSAIALAAGSIVLGIAVNYSLHFIAHLKHTQSIPQTIRDLAQPMNHWKYHYHPGFLLPAVYQC